MMDHRPGEWRVTVIESPRMWLGSTLWGVFLCCAAWNVAHGTDSLPNPCLGSVVVFDTSSIDTIVNHPEEILADPEGFWETDSAYILAARWHHVLAKMEIPWDEWKLKIRGYAEMTEEERAADPDILLAQQLATAGKIFAAESVPLICSFLPATGAPLDTTVHLSAALTPYNFMTMSQIVTDVTSPVFYGEEDAILNLLTHEAFHMGYGRRRGARRELELDDPALYQMIDSLHNEGMATWVGYQAMGLYPEASHEDYTMLEDPAEVRRLHRALNELFEEAPDMGSDARHTASWELGVTQRAYYVVGAHMARAIESTMGRPALVRTVVQGPRSFVSTYNEIAEEGMEIVEFPGPATEPPIHRLKLAAYDRDEKAVAQALAELRQNPSDNGPSLEPKLNRLGYYLLGEGRVADATAVFELMVDLHPDSANAYDSLGEAYMNAGDTTAAVTSYEKSLDLNPENTNAAKMLDTLRATEIDQTK